VIKFYPDGYRFIFGSLILTAVASIILFWDLHSENYNSTFYILLTAVSSFSIITLFMAFFFRDPERNVPEGKGLFVSPADGKVILIRDVYEKDYLKSDSKEISIFMSPFNVHVNRAPCEGKVSIVGYSPGQFLAAYRDDASIKNENIVMVLKCKDGNILVRQVAGFIARRAVCKAKVGDILKTGERYGIIKFSSRLDVYLPVNTKIKVQLGEKVKAGETILGKI
jgi:phosphatidylserine decarboxylase